MKAWLCLFAVFTIYTIAVYSNCDKGAHVTNAPSVQVTAGWHTWQEKNCQSCHQLYGLGGYMGPDLTNVASDTNKNRQYLRTFIKYGTGRMPNFHLEDSEVDNLIAFLIWVDKSGKSEVPKEHVSWTGNYNIE